MPERGNDILCVGCGASVRDLDGPTHPYIGASAGCWQLYCDVLALEYGEYGYPACHRLTVDAYAVQHPGRPSQQSIQSVGLHLVSLHLSLEEGLTAGMVTARMRDVLRAADFVWLEPPSLAGTINIVAVAGASGFAEHERRVREWAESVWAAWRAHHATVKAWAHCAPRR